MQHKKYLADSHVINRFDQKDEDDFICGAYVSIFAKNHKRKEQEEL